MTARGTIAVCMTILVALTTAPARALAQTVRVASELDFPPFALVRPDGQPDGFTVDLFKAVARTLGLRYEIAVGPWGDVKDRVAAGRADVLINMAWSKERAEQHDFTVPHTRVSGAIFVRKGDQRIRGLADIAGRSVLVLRGDLPHEWAVRQGWAPHLVPVDRLDEAMRLLASGRYDAVLAARLTGLLTLKAAGIADVAIAGPPITEIEQKFCFAVRKGDAELLARLNEGLALVRADGTFDALYDRWFGAVDPRGVAPERIALYAVPVALVVVLALVLLNVRLVRTARALRQARASLEERVSERTAELASQRAFLRQVIDADPSFVFVKDRDGRFLLVNEAVARTYGTTTGAIVGKLDADLNPNRDEVEHFRRDDLEVIDSGQAKLIAEEVITDSQGRRRWLQTVKMPLPSADGTVGRLLGVSVDITARRDAEQRAHELNAELEQRVAVRTQELAAINAALERFTYSVSHDLKAPLRGIEGYSQLLESDYARELPDEAREFVGYIRDGVKQMGRLIDDLLAYSRIERTKLAIGPVDVAVVVDAVLAELHAEIARRGIDVRRNIVVPSVRADRDGLRIALRNLVDNAVKFSPREGAVVTISCEAGPGHVRLCVADQGVGFDMRYVDRIFQIFQRLHRVEDYPGTGVGLAIVRKAMERMGGQVHATSVVGRGSTFCLELPA